MMLMMIMSMAIVIVITKMVTEKIMGRKATLRMMMMNKRIVAATPSGLRERPYPIPMHSSEILGTKR